PSRLHPTVWMGWWLAYSRTQRRTRTPYASFIEGALSLYGGVALSALTAYAVSSTIGRLRMPYRNVVTGLALKPALSLRPLLAAATSVQVALERHHLIEARQLLGWHLVSRDTTDLSPAEVAGAAIESVAENLSDSVVAPLLAFRLGGLPLAYAYRMINTADAMLGYRTRELEWFGKMAARSDDVANFIPARCSAVLIACAAACGGGSTRRAIALARLDASRTTSPNAGWPMAAMAGALSVRLTKRDLYSLNTPARLPRAADIGRACRIVAGAATLAAIVVDLS
ncbi:MAG TPA: adenosylcobinamide-phosphate synthase CbiB, partial [Gemmatimonadaceae bacterium]|nr:adenosylcobinamide-phosphate synthase CbiB [Gemmatimonadaceae bacterium]